MPPGALPFVFLLLHAAAVAAVPAAGGPEPQFTPPRAPPSTHRRAQAAGACNGMMMEMQPIAASCCGNNMEFCTGPVPSQCSAGCKPIFESFYARCQAMITRDVNGPVRKHKKACK